MIHIDRAFAPAAAAVAGERIPAATLGIVTTSGERAVRLAGMAAIEPEPEALTQEHWFDLASVSKVVATTPMILRLAEQGRLDLDRPLTDAIPDLRQYDVANAPERRLTFRDCLAHRPTSSVAGVLDFARGLLDGSGASPAMLEAIRTPYHEHRTCGWERRFPGWSGGGACSAETIGHTGFTGTGLWVDFERGLAWTLLTNRVHPTRHRDGGIFELRPATGDAVIAAFDAA